MTPDASFAFTHQGSCKATKFCALCRAKRNEAALEHAHLKFLPFVYLVRTDDSARERDRIKHAARRAGVDWARVLDYRAKRASYFLSGPVAEGGIRLPKRLALRMFEQALGPPSRLSWTKPTTKGKTGKQAAGWLPDKKKRHGTVPLGMSDAEGGLHAALEAGAVKIEAETGEPVLRDARRRRWYLPPIDAEHAAEVFREEIKAVPKQPYVRKGKDLGHLGT